MPVSHKSTAFAEAQAKAARVCCVPYRRGNLNAEHVVFVAQIQAKSDEMNARVTQILDIMHYTSNIYICTMSDQ